MPKVFLSYHFPDEPFVAKVDYYLRSQPSVELYFWPTEGNRQDFVADIGTALQEQDEFVFFRGASPGETQKDEAEAAYRLRLGFHIVDLAPGIELPGFLVLPRGGEVDVTVADHSAEGQALECAQALVVRWGGTWTDPLDVPVGYPFEYEKDIIKAYAEALSEREGRLAPEWVQVGCPEQWPDVPFLGQGHRKNTALDKVGGKRDAQDRIIVDGRARYLCTACRESAAAAAAPLTLPEAGPRERLAYPAPGSSELTVGILVSGGIAPGINAVIRGIVERHHLYADCGRYGVHVKGCAEGLKGLIQKGETMFEITPGEAERHALDGGSFVGTSRADELLDPRQRAGSVDRIIDRLQDANVEIMYIIGGDGSMRAAHAIWKRAQDRPGVDLSVVGVPKTMDNDILWVWQAFGFLSATERAKEALLQLRTESRSNPRLCVVQLFGSDSGFVVAHAALASGVCDAALIPESPFSMSGLFDHIMPILRKRLSRHAGNVGSPHGLIAMAETAVPTDVMKYLDDANVGLTEAEREAVRLYHATPRHRVQGQTPDALRTAGLKVVSRVLQQRINAVQANNGYWKTFRVFTNEPRHLLRAIGPSLQDVISGQRLGTLAVDNAIAGYTDFMVSQWLTEFVLVPLRLVALGRKRVPPTGIFWKSVIASTRQPADLTGGQSRS